MDPEDHMVTYDRFLRLLRQRSEREAQRRQGSNP
jgi:hypothetical protein